MALNQRYDDYLKSEEWKKLRLQRLELDNYHCARCTGTKNLQVHHLTYERIGAEDINDLQTLCGDCHHGDYPNPPKRIPKFSPLRSALIRRRKSTKAAKHVTLSDELISRLETEAALEHVTVSAIIESHLHDHYQKPDVIPRLERIESAINDLRATILPVVAKVAALIQQFEQEQVMSPQSSTQDPPLRVLGYREMYGDEFDKPT